MHLLLDGFGGFGRFIQGAVAGYQPPGLDDLKQIIGNLPDGNDLPVYLQAAVYLHGEKIPFLAAVIQVIRLNEQHPVIDAVAVKNAGKGFGHNASHTQRRDAGWGKFPRGTAAKVLPGHKDISRPGRGGQLVRSAGDAAQLMAKEGKYAALRLPSGEMRMVPIICRASIGVVGNGEHNLVNIGKAGRKRHMGIRPTVRGSVMNPNDHPHGGGEGKTGIGRPGPCTPWGKPALGLKTRKKNKASNKLIVRRRDGKALSK